MAGNALQAQKKALRTSTLSLNLSFLGFTLMLCFLLCRESVLTIHILNVTRMPGMSWHL